MESCFECGKDAEFKHHVIPKSRGGKNTVPLCGMCHSKAHHLKKKMSISTLTKDALAYKRSRGEKTGGDVPFGYRLAADGRTLEEDVKEQEAVRLILARKKDGLSLRAIAARMNSDGYRTKKGCQWSQVQVKRIIRTESLR